MEITDNIMSSSFIFWSLFLPILIGIPYLIFMIKLSKKKKKKEADYLAQTQGDGGFVY